MTCCSDDPSSLEMDDINHNNHQSDARKYGKPYRNQDDDGSPIKEKRKVTDIACLILFLVFLGAWVFVAVMAIKDGNIAQVIYPSDSQGNICGIKNKKSGVDLSSRKYLFFFDFTRCFNADTVVNGCLTPQVCVEKCPDTKYSPFGESISEDEIQMKSKMRPFCKEDLDSAENKNKSIKDLIEAEICPAWYLPSKAILGRCIPTLREDRMFKSSEALNGTENTRTILKGAVIEDQIFKSSETLKGTEVTRTILTEAVNKFGIFLSVREFGEKVFNDLADTWWMICLALLAACLLSFLWIFLLKKAASFIVWITIWTFFILVGGLLAGSCYKLVNIYTGDNTKDLDQNIFQVSITPNWHYDVLELKDTWLAFTIILGIFFFVMLVIIIFLRNRIKLAIRIIEEGSKAVGNVCSTLFFPFIPFCFQVLTIGWFLTVAMFLASSGIPEFRVLVPNQHLENCTRDWEKTSECTRIHRGNYSAEEGTRICDIFKSENCPDTCEAASCNFVRYKKNSDFTWMQAYNVFGLYWTLFFFTAYGEIVLAKVFAEYFWQKLAFKKKLPQNPVFRAMNITALYHLGTVAFGSLIVAIIRVIRKVLQWLEDKANGWNNGMGRCILCFCKCCFWCLEVFMKFVNRNAYILCAVKGTNYCKSAKNAFELIIRNPVRFAVIDSVCDFLLFIGKCLIVGSIGVASYFSFNFELPDEIELNYMFLPILIIIVGSFLITSSFFDVFAMAVDTIFLCALEDIERNNGAKTPRNLLKVFKIKNTSDINDESAVPSCPPISQIEPHYYSSPRENSVHFHGSPSAPNYSNLSHGKKQ